MKYMKRLAAVFMLAATGNSYADDQAVVKYTNITTSSNNTLIMANMDNIGIDFLKRNLDSDPPIPNNPIEKAKDPSSRPQKGFWDNVAYELGVAVDEAVMAREIEKIEKEQLSQ